MVQSNTPQSKILFVKLYFICCRNGNFVLLYILVINKRKCLAHTMKKSTKIFLTVTVAAVLIITVLSAVFSYVAMTKHFDHELFYFNAGSAFGSLAIYLPVTASALAVICGIVIRKKIKFAEAPAANIPTVFTSVLMGLLMIASAVFTITGGAELSRISMGVIITGIIGGIYFLLFPFMGDKPYVLFLSFVPAIWAALKLLEEYFREGEPINSPIRTINLTMLAFVLLFFAEEIRFGIDRQIPGTYYFCTLSAVAFTGSAVLPKLAIILTDNSLFEFSFIEWCLGAAIFLFLLARLSAVPAALIDSEDSPVAEADTIAEEE